MHKVFRVHIQNTSVRQVFNLVANIDDYDTWLPHENTFYGIRHISDNPIKQGTTYTDGQGMMRMHGRVKTYKPPNSIAFEQKTDFRILKFLPAGLHILIDYVFVQEHDGTTVIRNYDAKFKGILKFIQFSVRPRMIQENERILQIMKQLLEKTF